MCQYVLPGDLRFACVQYDIQSSNKQGVEFHGVDVYRISNLCMKTLIVLSMRGSSFSTFFIEYKCLIGRTSCS